MDQDEQQKPTRADRLHDRADRWRDISKTMHAQGERLHQEGNQASQEARALEEESRDLRRRLAEEAERESVAVEGVIIEVALLCRARGLPYESLSAPAQSLRRLREEVEGRRGRE